MAVRDSSRGSGVPAKPAPIHLRATLDAQRRQLFRAGAVVNVCAIAVVDEGTDRDELANALECAAEVIDTVAGALESAGGTSCGL